jgi:FtsP/CotA-like multicopper oxidase with cupredoxin domain
MDMEEDEPRMALINNLMWGTEEIETPRANTVEQWNIINTTGDLHPIHLHLAMFQVVSRQKFDVESYIKANYPELDMGEEGMGPWPVPPADDFLIGRPRRPGVNEGGWKDTVQAYPGEVTTIMIPFGPVQGAPYSTSISGDYVFHCHILEHEDNEMMVPYTVLPPI